MVFVNPRWYAGEIGNSGEVSSTVVAVASSSWEGVLNVAAIDNKVEISHGMEFEILSLKAAKEIVIESLGIIFSVQGDAAIAATLGGLLGPVQALALMVFVLLYTPCIAVVGTIKKETGSWKWTGVSVAYQ